MINVFTFRCMSDEAAPYYVDMVDQQTLGHQFLLNKFGPKANPKTGWQVDNIWICANACLESVFIFCFIDWSIWTLHDDGGVVCDDGDELLVLWTYRSSGECHKHLFSSFLPLWRMASICRVYFVFGNDIHPVEKIDGFNFSVLFRIASSVHYLQPSTH